MAPQANPPVPTAPTWETEVRVQSGIGTVTLDNVQEDDFSHGDAQIGTGRVRIAFGDPQVALLVEGAEVGWLDTESLDYQFRGVITKVVHVVVDEGEESGEYVEATVHSHAHALTQALVYPQFGITEVTSGPLDGLRLGRYPASKTRYYNWTHPDVGTGGWPNAVERQIVCGPSSGSPPPAGKWNKPEGWIDGGARWIWSRALAGSWDPVGSSLFRSAIDVGLGGQITMDVAGDDGFRLWVDSAPVLEFYDPPSTDGWAKTHSVQLDMSPGIHHVAIEGINATIPWGPTPAGVLFSCYRAPGTFHSGATETIIANSNSGWKCLDYPFPFPSMTPGAIILDQYFEMKARGMLPSIGVDFSTTYDSAGVPWPPAGEFAFDVGGDKVKLLKRLEEAWVEWHMYATGGGGLGKTLQCYVAAGVPLNGYTGNPLDPAGASPLAAGYGTIRPVTLAKGSNVKSLVHTFEGG